MAVLALQTSISQSGQKLHQQCTKFKKIVDECMPSLKEEMEMLTADKKTNLVATIVSISKQYAEHENIMHGFLTMEGEDAISHMWSGIEAIPGLIESCEDAALMGEGKTFTLLREDLCAVKGFQNFMQCSDIGDDFHMYTVAKKRSQESLRTMKFLVERFAVRAKDLKAMQANLSKVRERMHRQELAASERAAAQQKQMEEKLANQKLMPVADATIDNDPDVIKHMNPNVDTCPPFSQAFEMPTVLATTIEDATQVFTCDQPFKVQFGSTNTMQAKLLGAKTTSLSENHMVQEEVNKLQEIVTNFHQMAFSEPQQVPSIVLVL